MNVLVLPILVSIEIDSNGQNRIGERKRHDVDSALPPIASCSLWPGIQFVVGSTVPFGCSELHSFDHSILEQRNEEWQQHLFVPFWKWRAVQSSRWERQCSCSLCWLAPRWPSPLAIQLGGFRAVALSYHPEGRENPVGVVLPRAGQGVVVPHQRVVMLLMQHCISISHWHQNILFIISLMMNRAIKAIICFHVAAPVARCLCIVPFVFGAISIVVFGERANTSRNCNNVQEHLELLAQ